MSVPSSNKSGDPPTFKDRVTEFWDWFARVADRFYETIEQDRCGDLTSEVVEFMDRTLPHLSWAFGPGEGGGHSFTLSGEGLVTKQLLAEYWHSRAREIPHWTFYGSRQPAAVENLKDMAIQVGEQEQVDVEHFLLKTTVDDEDKSIDLVAWHPTLESVPEEHHLQILFLLLDEALGEFGVQTWLGDIQLEPIAPGEENKRMSELPEFIQQVRDYHQWEEVPPLKAYSVYEISEQKEFRRGDTIVGTTCIPDIIFDFLDANGTLPEDPLEGTGAELAYVAIDSAVFPEGSQSDVRANIEDALTDALEQGEGGRALGGAFGTEESYIDLLLLDGENSRQIVQQTLKQLELQGRSRLENFV